MSTILSPLGTLLFDSPLAENDIDESIEYPNSTETINPPAHSNLNSNDAHMRVEVEDALGELDSLDINPTDGQTRGLGHNIESKILIKDTLISKARALSRYSKSRTHAGSTDRLRRVQDIPRFENSKKVDLEETLLAGDESDVLLISDPVATLLRSEKQFWLCIGEVNGLRVDGESVDFVSFHALMEDTVSVSYQMSGLRTTTTEDDPDGRHDWRTCKIQERTFTVPGCLIQAVNPSISKTHTSMPFYLFQSTDLVALTASLFRSLNVSQLKSVPKIAPSKEYPYRERSGQYSNIILKIRTS